MSNYNAFLSALNDIAEKSAFEVYIPTIKRNVKFKPVTAKQQKSFYTGIQENTLFNTQFIVTTYNIIKENCLEPDLVDGFNIIDRISILLHLRKNTLGAGIAVIKDNITYNLDFTECIACLQSIQVPDNKVFAIQNIQIELGVPTIIDQFKAEIELRAGNTKPLSYKEAILEIIASEICKTIKSVSLLENDKTVKLDYSNLTFAQRIALLDKLPAEALLQIQKYVKQVNECYENILEIKIDNSKVISFDINSDFFLSE